MSTKVEISPRTIVFILATLASIWLVIVIRDILFLILTSFIFMATLRPIVDWMEGKRIPRVIAIFVVYILVFGVFGGILASGMPSLITELIGLFEGLPAVIERYLPYLNISEDLINQQIAPISENIVRVTVNVFSNVIAIVSLIVFTFYFLLERHRLRHTLDTLFGETIASRLAGILRKVEKRLSSWLHGQLILMFIIGLMTYVGLEWLRIDFALPLAIIAGLLEIVPIIGPIVASIPAILIALTVSPFLALIVAGMYFLIQQVEGNVVVPMVTRRSVGLPPLVTIVGLMIGARLAGGVGVILAVPIILVLQEVVNDLVLRPPRKRPSEKEKTERT